MDHTSILKTVYENAMELLTNSNGKINNQSLSEAEISDLNIIAEYSERAKGVLAVFITSLVHKIFNPSQDIRKHQANMEGGYSGRTIDTRYVTPFLKSHGFPAPAESGWLTRSLEQNRPYDFSYPGKITPPRLKQSFLTLLDNIENKGANPYKYLLFLFQSLIIIRDKTYLEIAKPSNISLDTILLFLEKHFFHKYSMPGASRLPVLAIYSIYECMIEEMQRFSNKILCPLKEHTSADRKAGTIADIEIKDENNQLFEAIEIKHGININLNIINESFDKFKSYPVKRYYILSTTGIDENEIDNIKERIKEINRLHGCQVIINGIIPSLKYYLRLIKDPNKFIDKYVENMKSDKSIKYEHKETWNMIVAGNINFQ